MVDIKKMFRRMLSVNKGEDEREGYMDVNPSAKGLYIDTDGEVVIPHYDTIQKRDFRWSQERYSVVVPGLMEWYERYLRYVADPNTEFDWRGWHRDGLLFTEQIYYSLPREVTEEKLDSLSEVLGYASDEREPVISDLVVAGVKDEEGYIRIRLKIRGKDDSYTFHMEYDTLKHLRNFLENIALSEAEPSAWESQQSESGMYFYPQTIGGLKHMGQLHIFSEREFAFSAYVNSRLLVRSLYRSIMTHLGSLNCNAVCRFFQSNILECYIDDARCKRISFFRRTPKLANVIEPAFASVRRYLDSIVEDEEV